MPGRDPRYPKVIANWLLGERIGSGFSGTIFHAINIHTGEAVALKVQHINAECETNRFERYFYPALAGGYGIPRLYGAGVDDCWDYLAIELLGASLDSLHRRSGKDAMDLRSVCCIAMQVIERIETMHSRGILHRDIQLGNCVIGLPPNDQVIYMIDFGFSKCYIDPHTGRHIPDSKAKRDFIGNYWFTSVGVHCKGQVPSRRDDLEAIALMLIHLLTPGGLAWTRNGVPKTSVAHQRLKREKQNARPEDLCRGLPSEFEEFLRYCRRLKFAQCPDYAYWVNEFRELAKEQGFPASSRFVWPPSQPAPAAVKSHGRSADRDVDVVGILNDLANLQLGERQVLGAKDAVANGVPAGKVVADQAKAAEVIVLSSDDENPPSRPAHARAPSKANHLMRLARKVPDAIDNAALAQTVKAFADFLREQRSKALTKEGFAFLDAVYKQLADPSVYIQPMRASRPRGGPESDLQVAALEQRRLKQSRLWTLRCDVTEAASNKILAQLIADFGEVINRSSGRTLTKDAFGFLDELVLRLRTIA